MARLHLDPVRKGCFFLFLTEWWKLYRKHPCNNKKKPPLEYPRPRLPLLPKQVTVSQVLLYLSSKWAFKFIIPFHPFTPRSSHWVGWEFPNVSTLSMKDHHDMLSWASVWRSPKEATTNERGVKMRTRPKELQSSRVNNNVGKSQTNLSNGWASRLATLSKDIITKNSPPNFSAVANSVRGPPPVEAAGVGCANFGFSSILWMDIKK